MKTTFSTLAVTLALVFPASAIETILTPGAIADASEGGQGVIDLTAYKGQSTFVMTAKSTAGTNPTCTVKLQTSVPPVIDDAIMTGTTGGVVLRAGAADNVKLAASFATAGGETPTIYKVVLPLKKHSTLASGTLTLSLLADSSGPTGSALCSGTFDLSTLTASFTGATFTMTKPYTTAASTTYWLVLEGDYTADGTANVTWRTSTVASGGNSSVYDEAWAGGDTASFNFVNYVLNFSDITGGGFTQVTATGSVQEKAFNIQNTGWIRSHVTITGTNTPSFIVGVGMLNR